MMIPNSKELDKAIVRICDDQGGTVGTGFFIDDKGSILTCDHVVSSLDIVQVETNDGALHTSRADGLFRSTTYDLAILTIEATHPRPLPIDFGYETVIKIWTKGFQVQGSGVTDAFPLQSVIDGRKDNRQSKVDSPKHQENTPGLEIGEMDPGLSGAPLFDEETGVVIGLLNVESDGKRSFIQPFEGGIDYGEGINEAVFWNRQHIPRFGRFLNAAGARILCQIQTRNTLLKLQQDGLYLADYSFDRKDLTSVLAQFILSEKLILPVIGGAGVGKTSLLAWWGIFLSGIERPSLVFRGDLFHPTSTSLSDEITQTMLAIGDVPQAPIDRFFDAFSQVGERVVILIDGLNEVPGVIYADIETWIQKTIAWAEKKPVQLVVSSRPEFWGQVQGSFPADLMYVQEGGDANVFGTGYGLEVGNFDLEEAATAVARYHLEEFEISSQDIRHPLLVRVLWEMRKELEGPIQFRGRYATYRDFIRMKTDRVALDAQVEIHLVTRLLGEAAQWIFDYGSTILFSDFYSESLFGGGRGEMVAETLLSEHVFVETQEGLRFAFDEIAEFLQAVHVSRERIFEKLRTVHKEGEGVTMTHLGVLRFFTLGQEETGNILRLEEVFDFWLDIYRQQPLFEIQWHMLRTFEALSRPEKALGAILKITSEAVKPAPGPYYFLDTLIANWARKSSLSRQAKFEIFRVLARGESYDDWEEHGWTTKLLDRLSSEQSLPFIIGEEIQRDPLGSFRELMGWFGDKNPLRGSEDVFVKDVSGGLLFHYRQLALQELCDRLASYRHEEAQKLLFSFSSRDPGIMLGVCEEWVIGPRPRHLMMAARLCNSLRGRIPSKPLQPIYQRLLDVSMPGEVRDMALAGLFTFKETRASVIDEVIERFLQGDQHLNAWVLSYGLDTHFEQVMGALRQSLWAGETGTTLGVIGALTNFKGDDARQIAVIKLVENILIEESQVANKIAGWLEQWLVNTKPGSPAMKRLVAFAKHFIAQNPPDIQPVLSGARSSNSEDHKEILTAIKELGF